jgi:hypothetical protein
MQRGCDEVPGTCASNHFVVETPTVVEGLHQALDARRVTRITASGLFG